MLIHPRRIIFISLLSLALRLPDTEHVHVVPKVCRVYVLRESRKNTIGIANDFNAEADVGTDGSPTRLPGSGTWLHAQHVASVLGEYRVLLQFDSLNPVEN